MEKIKLLNVIERPKETVQTALLEGLTLHKALGNIITFEYTKTNHIYYVELNPSFWPKDFIDPFITIQLQDTKDSEVCTEFNSILNFTHAKKLSLKRVFRNVVLRQLIKYEALKRLYQFKYRIEKWH